eukprot:scaffold98204_cov20-Tisochrysis_lutea.AAC.1
MNLNVFMVLHFAIGAWSTTDRWYNEQTVICCSPPLHRLRACGVRCLIDGNLGEGIIAYYRY